MKSLHDLRIRELLSRGLLISLNSDDAAYNRAYLGDNFDLVQRAFDLTLPELKTLAANSFLQAFILNDLRQSYLDRLDAYLSSSQLI